MTDSAPQDPLAAGVYRRSLAQTAWPEPPVPQSVDLERALAVVRKLSPPTPLVESIQLSRLFRRTVYLKLESLAPVRSFKFRGALVSATAIAAAGQHERVFTASTGNHGQGVAYAARQLGLQAIVCAPRGALPEKLAAMEALGADVRIVGKSLARAQAGAAKMALESDGMYIEDGEDPALMAGAATVTMEVIAANPEVEALVVPVGGGNLIGGALLARQHLDSLAQIVGVQSTAAPGATASWLEERVVSRPCTTFAGGLATEFPGHLSWRVMDQLLEVMTLVDEADIYRGVATAFRECGLIVEGAAAATIAALAIHGRAIPGDAVALVITGSWLSSGELTTALQT